jgi:hypothetical protein
MMNLVLMLARFAIVVTLLGDASAGVIDTARGVEIALASPAAPFSQRSKEDLQRVVEKLPGTIPNEVDSGSNAVGNSSDSLGSSISPELVTPDNSKFQGVLPHVKTFPRAMRPSGCVAIAFLAPRPYLART